MADGTTTFGKYDQANSATDSGSFINLVIKIFISIIGVLGVIMIVLGGIQYMTTDAISKKEGGKEMITNSIFGLILALASWLILAAINPNLNFIKINPPQGTAVSVSSGDAPPADAQNAVQGQAVCSQSPTITDTHGVVQTITQGAPWAAGMGDDTANRQFLTSGGVAINANNCTNVGDSNCTSVAGYTPTQLTEIVALKAAVCATAPGCTSTGPDAFTLTGGTECWLHKTHGPGKPAADFQQQKAFNTFVTGDVTGTWPTACAATSKTFTGGSGKFLAEQVACTPLTTGIHWHVDFQ